LKKSFILAVIIFSAVNLFAQFGKNKVQYREFDWRYIQTKHFDIYFDKGENELAEFTAAVAESSLVKLSSNLNYNIFNRIPIIVFDSHNNFQQNNIIDEYLPEGVGGVTELFKNRVLVPFEGKYEQFRHVIHHELLHAFMNDLFYSGSIQNIISKNITLAFPNWFNEGMAEFQSLGGLDKTTDMFIRDAVINDYLPPIEYCDGYLAYRAGQSFFAFLADYYGEHKIGELMSNIKDMNDVNSGFKETYKLDIEKLSEKWLKELKKQYWSDSKNRVEAKDFARILTDHTKDGGSYNVSPVISPKGDVFAFISNRSDFFDVYLANANTGTIIDKVIEGNTSSNFEELQILTPGLSWSPDGKKLAISVKAGSNDAIFIVNIENGDKTKLPIELVSISYVSWSPTGDKLAFIGSNGNQSDLYIYDLNSQKKDQLTDDIFSDYIPEWSPDGKSIFFSSDRKGYVDRTMIPKNFKIINFDYSHSDIYRYDIVERKITQITNTENANEIYAQISLDGKKMLYISDINGINNIYIREADSAGTYINRPITNSLNPIDQMSLSKDGKKLLFVALNKGGYDIFSLDNPLERNLAVEKLEISDLAKKINVSFFTKTDSVQSKDSTISKQDSVKTKDNTKELYGKDIQINFDSKKDSLKNILLNDSLYANNLNFKIYNNLNPDGSFKINDYKIKFSPDLVYGNVDYSSFYGVQGVAQISLSDMLGNHRINIQTSMVIDLKNSDYAVSYFYLPKRIDYGFGVYHTARFLFYDNGFGEQLYRFRTYGGGMAMSYPLTKFRRVDGELALMRVSQENLDDPNEPIDAKTFLVPTLSFVFDNTLPGYTAPQKGTRYNITSISSPKLGSDGIGFTSVLGDFRHYIKLADDYTIALRLAGGGSFGPNPIRFYIGGTNNWLNREFEHYNIPISNVQEFAFSVPGLPLRGFNYDRMSGSKYMLTNLELRFPLFRYLILGALPLGFQNIKGVLFADAGTAWSNNKDLQLFSRNDNGKIYMKDLLFGTGCGTRLVFFGLPWKFDVAWSYDMQKFSSPKYYISLDLDF
jgi:Tol biopolymer transport system component